MGDLLMELRDGFQSTELIKTELTKAERQKMNECYDQIEGLQKSLPNTNSRFVVRDGANAKIFEISANKNPPPLHLFMFNDAIVLASKKKSLISTKVKYILEKSFYFDEVALVDMKEYEGANAFKIMKYPDTFMYRCETPEEKRLIMTQVKRVTGDTGVVKKKKSKNQKEFKALATPTKKEATPVQVSPSFTDPMPESEPADSPVKKVVKIPEKEMRFLQDCPDELDVLISYREFEECIRMIERGMSFLLSQ